MKKIIILFLIATICVSAQNNKGIHFQTGPIDSLLTVGQKENKPILVYAYTSWCGTCQWMKKNVFSNDSVAEFYNSHFINTQIDMTSVDTVPALSDIAKRYEIACYPSFLFLSDSETIIHRACGSRRIDEFIELGKDALHPSDNQYRILQQKCDSGKATFDEVMRYLHMRRKMGLPNSKVIKHYEETQSGAVLENKQNWILLRDFITDVSSPIFQYMLTHRDQYDKHYSTDSVDYVIMKVYEESMSRCLSAVGDVDTNGYKKLRDEALALNQPILDETVAWYDMVLYTALEDWDQWAQSVMVFIQNYMEEIDYVLLNNFAEDMCYLVNDTVYLNTALSWAKKSVEMQPLYFNTITYARLLLKLEMYTEAFNQIARAIKLAITEGVSDYSAITELLRQYK